MNKFIIIAITSVIVISSIFYGFTIESNSKILEKTEKIVEVPKDNPSDIITSSMSPLAKNILNDCESVPSCIVSVMWDLSKKENKQVVLETFLEIIHNIKQEAKYCHLYGHSFGSFLYSYTGNLTQAILFTDRTCGGSLYHGIMQENFRAKSLSENSASTFDAARDLCNEISDVSYSQIRSECLHGIGHGLVIANDFDAFAAMKKCEEIEDEFGQRACTEGASMENALAFRFDKGTFDENDVLFPCSVLDDTYEEACYTYHSIYILKKFPTVKEAFNQCEKHQNEEHVKYCFYGIGAIKANRLYENIENIVSACQKGNINYQTYCFAGAAYELADQIGIENSFELCNYIEDKFKMDCYETVGKWIHTIHFIEKEIEEYCSQLKNLKYYQVCMDANPEEIGRVNT